MEKVDRVVGRFGHRSNPTCFLPPVCRVNVRWKIKCKSAEGKKRFGARFGWGGKQRRFSFRFVEGKTQVARGLLLQVCGRWKLNGRSRSRVEGWMKMGWVGGEEGWERVAMDLFQRQGNCQRANNRYDDAANRKITGRASLYATMRRCETVVGSAMLAVYCC